MLVFRETRLADIDACFSVWERTRENAIPRERLAAIGITPNRPRRTWSLAA